uniref:PCNA-associated factor n=1 Tax=Sparus aurata TaxID=8175 RepID=A0A671TLK4_SPAAU
MVRTKADSVPGTYRKGTVTQFRYLLQIRYKIVHLCMSIAILSCSLAGRSTFVSKGKYAGGNPVCPRPTPTWQKGIGDFFGGPPRKPEKENQRPLEVEDDEEAGGSGMSKASRNLLVSRWRYSDFYFE